VPTPRFFGATDFTVSLQALENFVIETYLGIYFSHYSTATKVRKVEVIHACVLLYNNMYCIM